jgi:hypothetical protein
MYVYLHAKVKPLKSVPHDVSNLPTTAILATVTVAPPELQDNSGLGRGTKTSFTVWNESYEKENIAASPGALMLKASPVLKTTFKPSGEPYDFAACLLMKDDNVILPEWLAYHYQVLPLRHLIIGLDPFSLTAPDKIANEFRKEGMDITIWVEDDYFFRGQFSINRRVFANDTHEAKVAGYLWRQRAFMTRCLREFKRRDVRWTLLVDTDEYLTYNHFHNESEMSEVRGLTC